MSIGLGCRVARAAEVEPPGELPGIELHGFASQGFIKSTANNYLTDSERGSFDFSEVGINFTTQPTDKLRIGMQLFARRLGSDGTFSVKADWFYLDYHWRDWLGLRAGRVKLPFGLYNDISDIDAARVPVLLPESIYPVEDRDFLLAQNGLELYGYLPMGRAGALDYRLYAGAIFVQVTAQAGAPVQIASISNPYVAGGRIMWETPLEGLRIGGSVQTLRLDLTILETMPAIATATGSLTATLSVASIEYAAHNLLVAAEYGPWWLSSQGSDPMLFPTQVTVNQRGYGMVNYRFTHWFVPSIYYAFYYPNEAILSGRENMLHDLAGTLRFDVNPYWLIKVEGHYLHGTAGVTPELNNGTPPAMLTADWGLFLIKTTAYF